MEERTQNALRLLRDLVDSEPRTALLMMVSMPPEIEGDVNYYANAGGLFIDIGASLRNVVILRHGVALCLDAFRKLPLAETRARLAHHAGSGYSEIAQAMGSAHGYSHAQYRVDRKAKHWYEVSLHCGGEADTPAQTWVDYGNVLSHMGRSVEALSAYDKALAIDPRHPMALGNSGVELNHFAQAMQRQLFALDALRLLDAALASPDLVQYGGSRAKESFERTRKQVVAFVDHFGLAAAEEYNIAAHATMADGDYLAFCAERQLFLNLCLRCRKCDAYSRDSIGFSITTGVDEDHVFIRLSRLLNEIKERYCFARLLLHYSYQPPDGWLELDSKVSYTDHLDYAVYGNRVAAARRSFEQAYNVLDKIAHFINDYFGLGLQGTIAFGMNRRRKGLWHTRKKMALRQELSALDNCFVWGLYCMARDLDTDRRYTWRNGRLARLRTIRNALTHEYLVLHAEGIRWEDEVDSAQMHMSIGDFRRDTVTLFQFVRAAVIQLVGAIGASEAQKELTGGLRLPMPPTPYDSELFDSALDSAW